MSSKLQFKPAILTTLLTVFLAGLFIALGNWQLGRAEEKTQLLERQQRMAETAVTVLPPSATVGQAIDEWRYRRVSVKLEWLPEKQFLLDNQVHRQTVGFHALTPARVMPDGDIVLIDRGWVPQGQTRDHLPVLRDLDGVAGQEVTLQGVVYAPFGESFRLDDDVSAGASGWPRVVQFLDFEALGQVLGMKLAPFIIRMSPDAANGFVRQWAGVPFTPEKHIAYAWQWFFLAAGVVGLFFALNIKRRRTDGGATP